MLKKVQDGQTNIIIFAGDDGQDVVHETGNDSKIPLIKYIYFKTG